MELTQGIPPIQVVHSTETHLPDGPYALYLATDELFAVRRLYIDAYKVFIGGGVTFDGSTNKVNWLNLKVLPRSSTVCGLC